MAAKISSELGIKPELVKGANGVFDVVADGKLIFSRHQTGHFPEHEEIIKMLRR